jgi:polar amino acid transport system substrate-binding protein
MLALAGMLAASLVVAACSDDDDGDGGDETPAATSAATSAATAAATGAAGGETIDISGVAELEDGTLTFGSDIAYPPIEFLDDSNNPVGLDIDLANAMGEVLGVEVVFENGAFDGLLPALDAERYDAIMSAMSVNDERKAIVDFVEYFNAGYGVVVAAGNPEGVASLEDLCGLTVAVQEGTLQAEAIEGSAAAGDGQSKKCTDAGEDAIELLKFGTDPEAVQALIAGQADANISDFPVAAYSASENEGEIELVTGYQFNPGPYGIALRKTSTDLNDVLQAALDQIQADGTYETILEKWNLAAGAVE